MDDFFSAFMGFICIGGAVLLLLITGIDIAHSTIEDSCDRHGRFYIGDNRFECARTQEPTP